MTFEELRGEEKEKEEATYPILKQKADCQRFRTGQRYFLLSLSLLSNKEERQTFKLKHRGMLSKQREMLELQDPGPKLKGGG